MTAPAATPESAWPGPALLAGCLAILATGLFAGARAARVPEGALRVTTFPEAEIPR